MDFILSCFNALYVYCTDFIINLANLSALSYYEINFIIFIILYPLLLILGIIAYRIQKARLKSNESLNEAKNRLN